MLTERPTLGSLGQVYVTASAARRYADYQRMQIEGARRELTALLLGARVIDMGPPTKVRYRSNATGLDISATVAREGELWIVLSVHVRPLDRR